MMEKVFNVIEDIVKYVFDIKWWEIPRTIFYILAIAMISYLTSMFVIGFPCAVIRHFTKFELKKEDTVINFTALFLGIFYLLILLYEKVT